MRDLLGIMLLGATTPPPAATTPPSVVVTSPGVVRLSTGAWINTPTLYDYELRVGDAKRPLWMWHQVPYPRKNPVTVKLPAGLGGAKVWGRVTGYNSGGVTVVDSSTSVTVYGQ